MPIYFSPTGNPEIWKDKPSGYYTPEEWEKKNAPPLPVPPTLTEAKTAKIAEIMTEYSAAFAPFKVMYPAEEREGWTEQKAEALAYLADPTAETPILSILIKQRGLGESLADFAQLVLTKSATWKTVYGYLTGQQQRMCQEVENLKTVDEVLAYQVEYNLHVFTS